MHYTEADVEWTVLSGHLFEELCYDVLVYSGFRSLSWRVGPYDKGRDIEGEFTVTNPLIGEIRERWFFECKNHSSGVGHSHLGSAVQWADVERPDHLVFVVAPHVTNECRDWIELMRRQKPYRVHLVEGKQMATLVARHGDLVERYFADRMVRLFRNAYMSWMIADAEPGSDLLYHLCRNINPESLDVEELAFTVAMLAYGRRRGTVSPLRVAEQDYPRATESFAARALERLRNLALGPSHARARSAAIEITGVDGVFAGELVTDESEYSVQMLRLVISRDGTRKVAQYSFLTTPGEETLAVFIERDLRAGTIVVSFYLLPSELTLSQAMEEVGIDEERVKQGLS